MGPIFLRASPRLALAQVGLSMVQSVIPAVVVYATGRFLSVAIGLPHSGFESAQGVQARNYLLLLAVAVAVAQMVGPVQSAITWGYQRRFGTHMSELLMRAVGALPGLEHLEEESFQRKLELARNRIGWQPTELLQSAFAIYGGIIQALAMGAVASQFAWWAPLVVAGAAIPSSAMTLKYGLGYWLVIWRGTQEARHADYARRTAMDKLAAKEIRIADLGAWLQVRKTRYFLSSLEDLWRARRRGSAVSGALLLLQPVALLWVATRMLDAARQGGVDAGHFMAEFSALTGCMLAVAQILNSLGWARDAVQFLPVAFELLETAERDPRLDVRGTRQATPDRAPSIRFRGVSFTYPRTDRKILDRLDLDIEAGTSVALVGVNGAGKTTLIKLLCRFYDPDEGSIELGGVDVREYDLASYRARLAVIFQDFVKYSLTATENIGVGSIANVSDESMVRQAAQRIGVLEKLDGLPSGFDTVLDKQFEGGAELSGGEWQRVALARALMAQVGHGADVLVLDEPTASLDVRTEHDLYQRFEELSHGRTTILVSHRFSTVRMASRVIYLEHGRVVEDGSHHDLMRLKGRYAELYRLQAAHFKETGSLE